MLKGKSDYEEAEHAVYEVGKKIKIWIFKKVRETLLVCVQWDNVKTSERNQIIFLSVIKKPQTQTLGISVAQHLSKHGAEKYVYDGPAWTF